MAWYWWLLAWFLGSLPLGALMGKAIKATREQQRRDDDRWMRDY